MNKIFNIQNFIFLCLWWQIIIPINEPIEPPKKDVNNKQNSLILALLNIANNNTLPILTKGQNFVDDKENYLICPEILYPNSSLNDSDEAKKISSKSGIRMEEYLNKTITFEEEVLNEENEIMISTIDAKIIGLYKVNKYEINDNICYGNINLRKETYNK